MISTRDKVVRYFDCEAEGCAACHHEIRYQHEPMSDRDVPEGWTALCVTGRDWSLVGTKEAPNDNEWMVFCPDHQAQADMVRLVIKANAVQHAYSEEMAPNA